MVFPAFSKARFLAMCIITAAVWSVVMYLTSRDFRTTINIAFGVFDDVDLIFKGSAKRSDGFANIAVCIVGQLQRLETRSKIDNFVALNSNRPDRKLFVIGVLDSGISYSNNLGGTHGPCYPPSTDLRPYFHKSFSFEGVVVDTHYGSPTSDFHLSDQTMKMFKHYRRTSSKQAIPYARIQNHLRQFAHDSQCFERVKAIEVKYNMTIDILVRMRDNAIVAEPFDVIKTMDLVKHRKVMVKRCNCWGGYSDKVWIIPRRYIEATMAHVVNDTLAAASFLLRNPPTNSEQLVKTVWNHYGVPISKRSADDLPVVDGRCVVVPASDRTPTVTRTSPSHVVDIDSSSTSANETLHPPRFERVPYNKDCWPGKILPPAHSSFRGKVRV